MGGHAGPKSYMGWWGDMGSPKQKGITTYSVSPYASKPFKGAFYNAFFNVWRRTKGQAFYVLVPAAIVYKIYSDAVDYNTYLYTKAGREELERVS
ncbi:hypothetical protein BABINDRAFT_30578 [Babjeviella inositovora NRRL Y-12698]|uniref:Cytochrome b-c1 complex subunit 8 n=1 Tax=Babjeviella inositovora NRRL Y-12698 TaxID=984486 RepID=A0A1E3QXD7_9ASCO|nr:uncharacterized protein BABINDRAFT_30578 [Babjeviella inositovora NRRL Y-12698]ODQ82316.1 hypothetical protein BABINDRAFT_30578 [Babjeviella inositovora NRRL Y-12698]